jgi:hypothetical protein
MQDIIFTHGCSEQYENGLNRVQIGYWVDIAVNTCASEY